MPTKQTADDVLPEAAISLTVKSGKGYDADMLTLRGQTYDDFHATASSVLGPELLEEKLDNLRKVPVDAAPAAASSAPPAASSGGGGGDWQANPPTCNHGPMKPQQWTAKSGPKVGQPQYTFFCPQPREATDKCSPVDALTRKPWGGK